MSPPTRVPLALAAAVGTALLCACGGGSSTTPAATPTARATRAPTATPTALPPDVERVEVVDSFLATYLETTQPVATVRNDATQHTVTQLTVHFAVLSPAGAQVGAADVSVGGLGPGQLSPIAARIGLAGQGDHLVATVTSATFGSGAPSPYAVGGAQLRCASCGGPRGASGDAVGQLTTAAQPGSVSAHAACFDATARLVGGGATVLQLAGGERSVDVPVIVDGVAATCTITVFPLGF